MTSLLVTYDLKKPGQDYKEFYDVIKSYSWARLSESSYAIDTEESPKTVYDKLSPYIDVNDQVFIIGLRPSWYGHASEQLYQWLRTHL
jgi:hypothetical protein